MINENKAGSLYIDYDQIEKELGEYFYDVIVRCCEVLIDYIRVEIPLQRNIPKGKQAWREQLQNDFKILSVEIANSVVTGKVGPGYLVDSREYIIAMIIDQGHAGEIWTRPGEETYDSDMYLHTSKASAMVRIQQFEQTGTNFMKNAIARMRSRFDLEMKHAMANIPKSIFSRNMTIK